MEKSALLSAGLSSSLSLFRKGGKIMVKKKNGDIKIAPPPLHLGFSQRTLWLQISPQLGSRADQDYNQNLSGIPSVKTKQNKRTINFPAERQTQRPTSLMPKAHQAAFTSCDSLNAGYPTWQVTVWVCVAVHFTPSVCEWTKCNIILVQEGFTTNRQYRS